MDKLVRIDIEVDNPTFLEYIKYCVNELRSSQLNVCVVIGFKTASIYSTENHRRTMRTLESIAKCERVIYSNEELTDGVSKIHLYGMEFTEEQWIEICLKYTS